VQAGVGIGPVQLGASRASLASLGLTWQPSVDPQVEKYGAYTVHIGEGDAVDWVEVALSSRDLPGGLRAYGRPLSMDSTALKPVLAELGNCDPAPSAVRGRVVCDQGRITVIQNPSGGAISLRVSQPEPPASAPAPAR